VPGTELTGRRPVVVEAGEVIPGDGDVVEGIATVDESAITGESAPGHPRVGRRPQCASPAARRCCRTGSSCAITSKPGETFIDRMIALVEGAARQKTPNEIALNILLAR
jgi:K+-transporting ATPase ATPase B chain